MAPESFLCGAMAGKAGRPMRDASLILTLPEQSPTLDIKTIFSLPYSAIDYLLEPD